MWDDRRHILFACGGLPWVGPDVPADRLLRWFEFNPEDSSLGPTSSPIAYVPYFWVTARQERPADYPELYGFFSPSARLVVYTVRHGGSFDPAGFTEIRVAATDATFSAVLDRPHAPFGVSQLAWLADESRVIYAAGYEGPINIYISDIYTPHTVELGDVSDFDSPTENSFSLSPDTALLAAVDLDGRLAIIHTRDWTVRFVVDTYCTFPEWAPDGNTLYYWWGTEWQTATELRAYHLQEGYSVTLFDLEDLRLAASAAQVEAPLIDTHFL